MSHHVFLPPESFVGWLLDGVIDAERCTALIARLGAAGFAATGDQYPGDYRNNDRLVLDDPTLAAWLFERTRDRLPAELTIDGERWVLEGLNPRFRACRYAGGQSFCIHRDGPYAPSADVRSHLTLQLYLDDDPARAGGRTRFFADPRGESSWATIDPRVGSAIVFDHRAWHDGEPVTRGIKHVLRTDVIYRRVAARSHDDSNVLYRHRGYAWHVIACRDGSIASAGRDGTVRRWRSAAPSVDATIDLGAGSVTRLAEASDGRTWAGTRSGVLFAVDGLRATAVARDLGAILGLAARPDGGVVASTSHGALVAFERNGSRAWDVRPHEGWAWAVAAAPEGYVSVAHDGTIVRADDRGTAAPVATLDTPLRAVAVTRDRLYAGDHQGRVHHLALDGSRRETWRAHDGAVTSIAGLAASQMVTAGEDGWVRVWSKADAATSWRARDFVTSLAVAPAGTVLWSSYDGGIYAAS